MAILKVKVQPGAHKNEISGMWLDMLKVKVTAQPESGKANKSCIDLLAKELNIPRNKIKLIKGHTGRGKQIQIEDLNEVDLYNKLRAFLNN